MTQRYKYCIPTAAAMQGIHHASGTLPVACKKALAASLNDLLEPFREKRAYYEAHRDEVRDIILTGSEKANKIGNETVKEVKEAMHIYIGD